MKRDECLKEEIESLRQELYRARERSESVDSILHLSQKLDKLILIWMQKREDEYTQKRASNL